MGVFLRSKGIFLHDHDTGLQLKRLTFKYCRGICRPNSDFISFPNKDFYSKRSQFDGFSCLQLISQSGTVSQSFFHFMTLVLLKIIGYFVDCLSVYIYDVSLLDLDDVSLTGIAQKSCLLFFYILS